MHQDAVLNAVVRRSAQCLAKACSAPTAGSANALNSQWAEVVQAASPRGYRQAHMEEGCPPDKSLEEDRKNRRHEAPRLRSCARDPKMLGPSKTNAQREAIGCSVQLRWALSKVAAKHTAVEPIVLFSAVYPSQCELKMENLMDRRPWSQSSSATASISCI